MIVVIVILVELVTTSTWRRLFIC